MWVERVDGEAGSSWTFRDEAGGRGRVGSTRCADGLIDIHNTVHCYAYPSEEAFQAANVSADGTEMERQCWGANLTQDEEVGGQGLISNPNYDSDGCPPV